jgi:hypothetical protein
VIRKRCQENNARNIRTKRIKTSRTKEMRTKETSQESTQETEKWYQVQNKGIAINMSRRTVEG